MVDSAGCVRNEYTYYMILEIGKSTIFRRQKLKYDRDKFINKVMNTEFLCLNTFNVKRNGVDKYYE